MKRLLAILLSMALCLSLAACGKGNDNTTDDPGDNTPPDSTQTQPPAVPDPPYTFAAESVEDKVSDEEGNLLASYSYTIVRMLAAEGADESVQAMADTFNAEMEARLETCLEHGAEMGDWAIYDPNVEAGMYYTDELTVSWELVGDYISVVYGSYAYTGGAHANSGSSSYLFDLERGVYIDPLEIADDPELFRATVTDLLLDQLTSRTELQGGFFEDYAATIGEWNAYCVKLDADAMTVIFSPYVLGPYAMGSIEMTVAYDEIRDVLGEGGVERLGI